MSISPKVLFLVGTVLGTSYLISQKIPSSPSPQLLLHHCFVVLEKTLESPLDCKEIQPVHPRGNQLWMFIGRTDAEAEAPILWPILLQKANSLEKILMLGKTEDRMRRGRQRKRWLSDITDSMGISLSKLWGMVKDREAWHAAGHGVAKTWTRLRDWTEPIWKKIF